jgi:hypothetical protein
MQLVDLSRYFTKSQSDARYEFKPQTPLPPSGISVATVVTSNPQLSTLTVTLTDPVLPYWADPTVQYVNGYQITAVYTLDNIQSSVIDYFTWGSSYIVTVPSGVSYSLTIKTLDYLNTYSGSSTVYTGTAAADSTYPAAPTITIASTTVTITSANTELDFDHYTLLRSQGGVTYSVIVPAYYSLSITDADIPTTASNYYYKVGAVNASGLITYSNILGPESLTSTAPVLPDVPTMAGATAVANPDASITITVPITDTTHLFSYRFYREVVGTTSWVSLGIIQYISSPIVFIDYLANSGTSYNYACSALNSSGGETALSSTYVTATSEDTLVLAPPVGLGISGVIGGVSATWTATGLNDATYLIKYRLSSVGSYTSPEGVESNQYTILDLTTIKDLLANELEIAVALVDRFGNTSAYGTYTATYSDLLGYQPASTVNPPAPAAITNVINNDGTIALSWSAPNVSGLSGYEIEQYDTISLIWSNLGTLKDTTQGTKSFVASGLEPYAFQNRQYQYRVRTTDNSGNITSPNLLNDSSFESGTLVYWSQAGSPPTLISSPTFNGAAYAASISNTSALYQASIAVLPLLNYTLSAYVTLAAGYPGTNPKIEISWYDISNTLISTIYNSVAATGTYQRVILTGVSPSNAVTAKILLAGDTSLTTSPCVYDSIQFEQSVQASTYADGKTLLLNAVETAGPPDYGTISLAAIAQVGQILITWNNPTSVTTGAFEYINGYFEIWRATNSGFTTSVTKIGEVPSNNDGAQNSYTDTAMSATAASTFYYKLKATDRYQNTSSYLNGGASVTATTALWSNSSGDFSGANGVAVDNLGNLGLKNKVLATTSGGSSGLTSSWADLPNLSYTSNSMLHPTLYGNPCLLAVNVNFSSMSSGGTISGITFTPGTGSTSTGTGPPTAIVVISGDGSGATASLTFSGSGTYPNLTFTGTVNITNAGNGYTAATAYITISTPSGTTYSGATPTSAPCTVMTPTPTSNVQFSAQILMDGSPITNSSVVIIPVTNLITNTNGQATYQILQLFTASAGSHTFRVQAQTASSYTVLPGSGSFQLIELG